MEWLIRIIKEAIEIAKKEREERKKRKGLA